VECSRWLKLKRGSKPRELFVRRRDWISKLAQRALAELAELGGVSRGRLHFDRHKFQALGRNLPPSSVPLSGSYAHERTLYLKSGKQKAPSATLLHKYIWQGGEGDDRYTAFAKRFGSKDFGKLTARDFHELTELARKQGYKSDVEYLDKATRLQHLAIPTGEGGLLESPDGKRIDTSRGPHTWTMDEYGNLLLAFADRTDVQFNHSSYSAGKNVICGGTIKVVKRRITYIDNSSGHYKPREQDLLAALVVLDDDDVDLSGTRVVVFTPQGDKLVEVEKQFRDGRLVPKR
jgi:hypothetical protein